jgi:hypothetical protein
MNKIETFLQLSHANYTLDQLNSVSHNANNIAQSTTRDEIVGIATSNSTISSALVIHKPYSFDKETNLLNYSRNILYPSLCLFEKVFNWKIHLTTESEIDQPGLV